MTDQYHYPNIWGRSILTSANEILGDNGVNALLNLAGLKEYIGNYPPDNIKKEFPFSHVARLQQALYDMYGSRGARVFATRGGEQTFKHSMDKYDKVQKAAQAACDADQICQPRNLPCHLTQVHRAALVDSYHQPDKVSQTGYPFVGSQFTNFSHPSMIQSVGRHRHLQVNRFVAKTNLLDFARRSTSLFKTVW